MKGNGEERPAAIESAIEDAKYELDVARRSGDQLTIDLAEEALNQLLDEYPCNGCRT